jgi:hypothetical protein
VLDEVALAHDPVAAEARHDGRIRRVVEEAHAAGY